MPQKMRLQRFGIGPPGKMKSLKFIVKIISGMIFCTVN
jgi:hypothetical protein